MDATGAEIGQFTKPVRSEDVLEKLMPCVCFWVQRSTCTLEFNLRTCYVISAQRMQLPESSRGTFLLCGDLTFPRMLCSLPYVLLLSSKLYPNVCNFWKLLSHITTDNPFSLTALCPCTSPFPMSQISSKTLFSSVLGHMTISPLPGVWMLKPDPRLQRC